MHHLADRNAGIFINFNSNWSGIVEVSYVAEDDRGIYDPARPETLGAVKLRSWPIQGHRLITPEGYVPHRLITPEGYVPPHSTRYVNTANEPVPAYVIACVTAMAVAHHMRSKLIQFAENL